MIVWGEFPAGNSRACCPACGKGPKDKTLGITIEADGRGVAHCHRCHYVATTQRAVIKPRPVPVRAAPLKHETLSLYGASLWESCSTLRGTMGEHYLKSRRCVLPPSDGDLRFHPSVKHGPSGYVGPALVALITDAVTREPMSLHRTWITPTGKAEIDPPRLLLGNHRKAGGVIRLWPDEAVTDGLGIAEGIETALALAHAFKPMWACIDAGNMDKLPVLAGIESLTIAADHDEAGLNAAQACADRWTLSGVKVRVLRPPKPKQDFNDLVQKEAA